MFGGTLKPATTKCGKLSLKCSQAQEETQPFRPVIVSGRNSLEKLVNLGSNSRSRPTHDVTRSESGASAVDGERSTMVVWEYGRGCHCVQSQICEAVSHQKPVMNNGIRTSYAS